MVQENGELARPTGRALDRHVHHRPTAGVVATVERDPERLAQAALDPVAGHQEAGADHLRPDVRHDPVVILAC
jgi:hypothetical protein